MINISDEISWHTLLEHIETLRTIIWLQNNVKIYN
jgi:hypothetical protein